MQSIYIVGPSKGNHLIFILVCRHLFLCVAVGLWAGLIIGFVTEYYTSNAYRYLVLESFLFLSVIFH